MYKAEGMGQEDEKELPAAKKGFAPFKQQRSKKHRKEKGGAPGPEDEPTKPQKTQQIIPAQAASPVVSKDRSQKKIEAKKVSPREKAPIQQTLVPTARVSQVQQLSKTSTKSSTKSSKVDSGRNRDDRHKVRRSERERDREERRRKRERRERREARQAEANAAAGLVAPAGSQVLPPISKSTHGGKSIQALKIDMAPGAHRIPGHKQQPISHRMAGHQPSNGYGGYQSNSSYHKMKYYSSVADSGSKRSKHTLQPHRTNRLSNRGYVGHNNYSSKQSKHGASQYNNHSGSSKPKKRGMFGLPSNQRSSGSSVNQSSSNSGQYGRHGYQVRKGVPAQSSRAPGRYESPYSQKNMKGEEQAQGGQGGQGGAGGRRGRR